MRDARFLVDEHIPQAIVSGLRQRGIDAASVGDLHLLASNDLDLLDRARADGRVIVTHDPDFLRLHGEDRTHAGIVFVPRERSIGDVIRFLSLVAQVLGSEGMAGRIEFA